VGPKSGKPGQASAHTDQDRLIRLCDAIG